MRDEEINRKLNDLSKQIATGASIAGEGLPKSRWVRFSEIVKIIGGVLALATAVCLGFSALVSIELSKQITPVRVDIATLKSDGESLRREVNRLLDWQAKQVLHSKNGTVDDIKNAAVRATQRKLDVSPSAIAEIGQDMLNTLTPDKWAAATALLDLRSAVNSGLPHKPPIAHVITESDQGKLVRGTPNEWIEFSGKKLILDAVADETPLLKDENGKPGRVYRYMVFKDCHIVYRGAPIILDNVFFENCTFEINNNNRGEKLARTIFASEYPKVQLS